MTSEATYQLLSYTRKPKGIYGEKLAYSMHLAYRQGDGVFQSLNHNTGVLFARAIEKSDRTLQAKCLTQPYIFKLAGEAGYGVLAIRTEPDGSEDRSSKGQVLFYTTTDFLDYEEKGLLHLNSDTQIRFITCFYQEEQNQYVLRWCDADNQNFKATFTSVESLDLTISKAEPFGFEAIATSIEGAEPVNTLSVPKAVVHKLIERLTVPENIGVQLPEKVTVQSLDDLDAIKATYLYSDDTTVDRQINWDKSAIDLSKPGMYEVTGEVAQPSFYFPVSINRADPCVTKFKGAYYFIATNDADGNHSLSIRKAATLAGLVTAPEYEIINTKMYPHMVEFLWAPEFHVIGDALYILLASSPKGFQEIRCHVMKLKPNGDLTRKEDWEEPLPFLKKDGSPLSDIGLTLDMTYVTTNHKHYVIWAQRDLYPNDLGSWIYIGEIDPAKPWQLISDPVLLSKPDYSWANNHVFVEEGPYPLFVGDQLLLTTSSALVDYTYCVGMLTIDKNKDLLDVRHWKRSNYPLLTSASVPGECGPGHNAYVKDEEGLIWNTYHARVGKDGPRSSGVRRVHFHKDGFPVLDLTEEKDILPINRKVTLRVEVKAD